MASIFQGTINGLAGYIETAAQPARYREVYKENCDRIYSLAFWMTDNELAAEQLSSNVFLRAFSASSEPTTDQIDRALLAEVRELYALGTLTLNKTAALENMTRGNVKRIHLERAVVQLPATERLIFLLHDVEGYEHQKIARLLGLTENESCVGLHQARIRVRELIAEMQNS